MHLFDRYSDHDYQFELLGEEEGLVFGFTHPDPYGRFSP